MHTAAQKKRGFTLVEIMIVVAIIGLLAAMAIPNLIRARQTSQARACVANLREIDSAKQQWALEHGSAPDTEPGENDLKPYIGYGAAGSLARVKCPLLHVNAGFAGYKIKSMKEVPTCDQRDDTHLAFLE